MPDFHDPETRKTMEAEGWSYVEKHVMYKPHFMKTVKPITVLLFDGLALYGKQSVEQIIDKESFQAAKDAADALLKGVVG